MLTTVKERLIHFLDSKGVSKSDFGRRIGVSSAFVTSMRKSIQPDKLSAIQENFPDLDINWLLTGEGEMLKGSETVPEEVETLPVAVAAPAGVPYYDEDFLLGFDELVPHGWEHPEYYIRMPGYEKATMWCNASGHSMEPEISNGDIIAMKKIEDPSFLPFGDVYGIITTNGLRTIKRLGRSDRDGFYRLIPTNKEYDVQEIPISMIAIVYRVMGAMKAF